MGSRPACGPLARLRGRGRAASREVRRPGPVPIPEVGPVGPTRGTAEAGRLRADRAVAAPSRGVAAGLPTRLSSPRRWACRSRPDAREAPILSGRRTVGADFARPGREPRSIRFGGIGGICQDCPVAPAGRRGHHTLTVESRLPLVRWSCAAAPHRRTSVGDPMAPPHGGVPTNMMQVPPGRGSRVSRIPRHARPRGWENPPRRGEQAAHTDGPAGAVRTGCRARHVRTRETYGGTEDPHQAQGL